MGLGKLELRSESKMGQKLLKWLKCFSAALGGEADINGYPGFGLCIVESSQKPRSRRLWVQPPISPKATSMTGIGFDYGN
jgi:hypothetical protein